MKRLLCMVVLIAGCSSVNAPVPPKKECSFWLYFDRDGKRDSVKVYCY